MHSDFQKIYQRNTKWCYRMSMTQITQKYTDIKQDLERKTTKQRERENKQTNKSRKDLGHW